MMRYIHLVDFMIKAFVFLVIWVTSKENAGLCFLLNFVVISLDKETNETQIPSRSCNLDSFYIG